MRKSALSIMVLLLLIPAIAFGGMTEPEGAAGKKRFDVTILEKSKLYTFDKFDGSWLLDGKWKKDSPDSVMAMDVVLDSSTMDEEWGPYLLIEYLDKKNEAYNEVTAFRAIVDDTQFAFEKLEIKDTFSYMYASTVMRDFLDALEGAAEVAFQIDHTDKFGKTWTSTVDPVNIASLDEIVLATRLLKDSNGWSMVSGLSLMLHDRYHEATKKAR